MAARVAACLLTTANALTLGEASGSDGKHIAEGRGIPGAQYFFSIGDFGAALCEQTYKKYNSSKDPELKKWVNHECVADRQLSVAKAMEGLAQGLKPQFVLSLGDNFYDGGIRDLEDPQLQASFEDVYHFGSLTSVPWHISLGDHDHRGNVSALVHYSGENARWSLPWSFYRFKQELGEQREPLRFFVTDSVGLEARYRKVKGETRRFDADYTEPEYNGPEAADAQWTWLNATLRQEVPSGALRIVVGHRPILSVVARGRTANEAATAELLRDILHEVSASQDADVLYLSGHDHAMQHLRDERVTYLSCGVGGLNLHPLTDTRSELVWAKNESYGFMVHELLERSMKVYFVAADSSVQHVVEIPLSRAIDKRTRVHDEF